MAIFPKRYIPKHLSKKDKKKQSKELRKSRKDYKNKKYYTRKQIKSFKGSKSKHVINAMKMYNVNNVKPSKNLAKKTKCKLSSLKKMMKKGQGAYFSSGSRPNQTAHSWGIARLASAITGGKASAVDYHILEKNCKPSSKALKLAKKSRKKYKYGRRKTAKVTVGGSNACFGEKDGISGCNSCCAGNSNCLDICMSGPMKGGYNMKGGYSMKETIVKFEKAKNSKKKYTAFVKNKKTKKIRKLHFGASDYAQYRDSTPLGLYKGKNHNDFKRMQRYYSRHSGTKRRLEAIDNEKRENKGNYTPKILSHIYLW
jgi:hypothetical protein